MELNPELQKVVGYPFNPLNFSTRRQLLDFLAANRLTDDLQPDDLESHSSHSDSQVSILPLTLMTDNVPGSVSDPPIDDVIGSVGDPPEVSASFSDSTPDLNRSLPSNSPSAYKVPVLDEFYPISETEFTIEPIAPESPPPIMENPASAVSDKPAQGPPNPWRRFTRAAKAKLKY